MKSSDHLIVPQGFFDCLFFLGRALGNDGIGILRVVVALPDGEATFALNLRDVKAGDPEAEV